MSSAFVSSSNPQVQEDSLDKIIARVDFFEATIEQLKKELPKYFQQMSETEKAHTSMSKVLKTIASTESHNLLQFLLFSYADKEEDIGRHQLLYRESLSQCKDLLDLSTKKLITPMKEIIQDHMIGEKKRNLLDVNTPKSATLLPGNTSAATTPVTVNNQQHLPAHYVDTLPLSARCEIVKSFLPIHAKLFEKHRVQQVKQILKQLLFREIAYHSKALEAYSQLFECLMEIESYDEVMMQKQQ